MLLYMRCHGGKPLRTSALAACATALTLWIVFEQLCRYPLYAGWLLERFIGLASL